MVQEVSRRNREHPKGIDGLGIGSLGVIRSGTLGVCLNLHGHES